MKLHWTGEAEQQRYDIWRYIYQENPYAALEMDECFLEATMRLCNFPELGRPGELPGTRELIPHESYRLIYEIEQEEVRILALVHTSRLWPPVAE